MRLIGFSTGALAYSDFRRGLLLLAGKPVYAVELSALRQPELAPLLEAFDTLDLSQFQHVSVHAPSKIDSRDEEQVAAGLRGLVERDAPVCVVVHPDTIHCDEYWKPFNKHLLLENMDRRKPVGQTADQLSRLFERFPEASLCFDIGHARQVDPSMEEAYLILSRFQSRLRQVHMSDVNSVSRHDALSFPSVAAFRSVASLMPERAPVILESPVAPDAILAEIRSAEEVFAVVPSWLSAAANY